MNKILRVFQLVKFTTGRNELRFRLNNFLWPLLFWIALFYRNMFLQNVKIIAVVGSLGKTTTTNVLHVLLGEKNQTGFVSNAFGAVALKVLTLKRKTEFCAIEVGIARKGDMKKYAKLLKPDYVIVTSIASDHSNIIGSLENIRKEKAKIFESSKVPELIVYNGDDCHVQEMVKNIKTKKISYGCGNENTYRFSNVHLNWPNNTEVTIEVEDKKEIYEISLFGDKMVYCFLAAFVVATELKLPREIVRNRIKKIRPVNGRMEIVNLKNEAVLIRDEFKSSAESVLSAINFMQNLPSKRRTVVFGKVSHIAKNQRQQYKILGEKVATAAENAFIIASKDFEQAFASAAKRKGLNEVIRTKGDWVAVPNRILNELQKGDVILVKGKREQKLERLSLILQGVDVKCTIKDCPLKYVYCKDCSQLLKV